MDNPTVTPYMGYTIAGQTCADQTLPVNASCTIDVQFAPASVISPPNEAALRIGFTDVSTTATPFIYYTTLHGAGVPSAQFSRLQFEPVSCRLPDTPVGMTSAPVRFRAQNSGTLPLIVSNVRVAGSFAATRYELTGTNCNGQTLPPGTSCTADVVFHPPGTGRRLQRIRQRDRLRHQQPERAGNSRRRLDFLARIRGRNLHSIAGGAGG